MFSPGQKNEKLGLTLMSVLLAEPWGEVWRAVHDERGRVLLIAYKKEGGRNLFETSRGFIKTWRDCADTGDVGLLKIHKVYSKSNPPLVMAEDPGGVTLRELLDIEGMNVKKSVEMAARVAGVIHQARGRGLCPLALTPDTIVQSDAGGDLPWHVLPIAPGADRVRPYPGEGRYVPRTSESRLRGAARNEDVSALTWLLVESIVGDFSINHDPYTIGNLLPYPRLVRLLQYNLEYRNGRFEDPNLMSIALDRWIEQDSSADYRDREKLLKKMKSKRKEDSATVERRKGKGKIGEIEGDGGNAPPESRLERQLIWGILGGVMALVMIGAAVSWFLRGNESDLTDAGAPKIKTSAAQIPAQASGDEAEESNEGNINAPPPQGLDTSNLSPELAEALANLPEEVTRFNADGKPMTQEEMALILQRELGIAPAAEGPVETEGTVGQNSGAMGVILGLALIALIPVLFISIILWAALNTLLLYVVMNYVVGERGDAPLAKCVFASGLLTASYFLLSLLILIHPFIGFIIAGFSWWKISVMIIEGVFELMEGGATVLVLQFAMNVGLILTLINI